jgi:hypothetical protein
MPAYAADRQTAVVSELRSHVDRFDALPYDVQQSLIEGAMSRPVPADTSSDRDALVQAKFKELFRANGVDPDRPETWRSTDYPARYAAMEQAERETAGYVAPVPQVDEFAIDGDLDEALAQARQEAIDAAVERNRANTAYAMAQQRIMRCDQEIANYSDLNDEVAGWLAESIKSGETTNELPYHLSSAKADLSRCQDRREIAHAASLRLATEARLAESNLILAERNVKAIASLIVMTEAADLADELAHAEVRVLGIAERLASLPFSYLPGMNGQAATLPPAVIKAINEPRVTPAHKPELVEQWRQRHAALVAGSGA